jgi:hypothetical protein
LPVTSALNPYKKIKEMINSNKKFPFIIDDSNREAVLQWLNDRNHFHTWFTSLIIGSFIVLTVFGNKPGFGSIGPMFLSISMVLLLFAVLCNLVCVWSIPTWKFRVKTGLFNDGRRLRLELAIPAWLGVICFVSALTLGFIGNLPS